MIDVLVSFAVIGVLVIGLAIGLLWRGVLLVGDRRVLDRLSSQLLAEQRMQAYSRATLHAMSDAVRHSERP